MTGKPSSWDSCNASAGPRCCLQHRDSVSPGVQSLPPAALGQVPTQPGRLHGGLATYLNREPQEGTCVPLTSVWPVLHTRRLPPAPAGHQQMLHTCSPSERAPFPGRDRAPACVLRLRMGPHLPRAALSLPGALNPSVQSPSQIQPVPTLASRSPLLHSSGHRTGTRRRRTRVGGGALAGSRGGECLGMQRRGLSDICPGNYGGRGLQDAARRGTEGLVRDGGARRGRWVCDLVVRGSGTSPGEKGRAARVWKEDWTLVRDGDRRGWTRAACGRFERVTLGAGGGRARPEFCWNAEKGGLGTGTCGWV